MKYILHYVGAMNRGGMESMIMNIYRNIDRNETQFHFVVHTNQPGDFDKEIEEMGGKIIPFPSYRKNPYNYRKIWNEFWRKNKSKYNVFHYHSNSLANITAIKSAFKYDFTNIIIHSHSTYANKGRLQLIHNFMHLKNQRYILKKKVNMVAASLDAAKWLYGNNIKENEVIIINNGINYKCFEFNNVQRELIRNNFNFQNKIIMGHVGSLLTVKNHEFIFEVFKKINNKHPDSILILFGRGPLEHQLKKQIKEIGIDKSVIFMGNVANINEFLNALDIFIFPSLYEGLGMAAVEAQINGLLTVISDKVPSDAIISKSLIQLSLLDDSSFWAKKILEAYEFNKVNRETINIDKKFDINNTILQIQRLYRRDINENY